MPEFVFRARVWARNVFLLGESVEQGYENDVISEPCCIASD